MLIFTDSKSASFLVASNCTCVVRTVRALLSAATVLVASAHHFPNMLALPIWDPFGFGATKLTI